MEEEETDDDEDLDEDVELKLKMRAAGLLNDKKKPLVESTNDVDELDDQD